MAILTFSWLLKQLQARWRLMVLMIFMIYHSRYISVGVKMARANTYGHGLYIYTDLTRVRRELWSIQEMVIIISLEINTV